MFAMKSLINLIRLFSACKLNFQQILEIVELDLEYSYYGNVVRRYENIMETWPALLGVQGIIFPSSHLIVLEFL